jgi:hypothetical protein
MPRRPGERRYRNEEEPLAVTAFGYEAPASAISQGVVLATDGENKRGRKRSANVHRGVRGVCGFEEPGTN